MKSYRTALSLILMASALAAGASPWKIPSLCGDGLCAGDGEGTGWRFSAQTAPLLRTVKAGDVAKYKLEATINIGGQQATYNSTITEKVTKVDANGNYTVDATSSDSKAKSNGEDLQPGPETVVTRTFKPNGELVDIVGERAGPEMFRYENLFAVVLPGKPVKSLDIWSTELKANPKTGAAALKTTYRVDGEEKIGTYDTFRIKFTSTEVGTTEQSANDETVWINKVDGSVVKFEASAVRIVVPGSPAPVSAKVVETRIA